MLTELVAKHGLGSSTYDDLFVNRNIIFGDFLKMGVEREERRYEEVADTGKLLALLEEYLDEYNLSSTNALNLGEGLGGGPGGREGPWEPRWGAGLRLDHGGPEGARRQEGARR